MGKPNLLLAHTLTPAPAVSPENSKNENSLQAVLWITVSNYCQGPQRSGSIDRYMRKPIGLSLISAVIVLGLVVSTTRCSFIENLRYGETAYYLKGTAEQRQELAELITLLRESGQGYEARYILLNEIIKILYQSGAEEELNLLLSTYVENNSQDPFNAYYLLVIAENYRNKRAYPFAVQLLRTDSEKLLGSAGSRKLGPLSLSQESYLTGQ